MLTSSGVTSNMAGKGERNQVVGQAYLYLSYSEFFSPYFQLVHVLGFRSALAATLNFVENWLPYEVVWFCDRFSSPL
jgi:hypothetical protein